MANKGSRREPYTTDEFISRCNNNNWLGGWVKEYGDLIYRSQSLASYTGNCGKSHPVPEDFYYEMRQNDTWLGGWVHFYQNEKKYYDANGTEFDSSLGYQNNPCPMYIYDEMTSNGIWEGGWVEVSSGSIRYIQAFTVTLDSGCGCGCGCGSSGSSGSGSGSGSGGGSGSGSGGGSGSGSGSGSGQGSEPGGEALGCSISAGSCKAGVVTLIINSFVYLGDLYIHWTAGNTQGQNGLSAVTISIRLYDTIIRFQENNMYAVWVNAYEMSVNGSFTVIAFGNVYRYTLAGGHFIIPGEYR